MDHVENALIDQALSVFDRVYVRLKDDYAGDHGRGQPNVDEQAGLQHAAAILTAEILRNHHS